MQVKLIIWDLDDTLWHGTLADGDDVALNASRADLVRRFNARGVVSSICSKNDHSRAEAALRDMGLWDQFVFPRIAFAPKPEAIRQIITDMQLRPANVLFVDDNRQNLAGAQHLLPDLQILDALAPDADAILDALLAAQPENARSRLDEYRMLERKASDRAEAATSNADFLYQCDIRASGAFWMDNLAFVDRIAELVNRSNQLNYTQSRIDTASLTTAIMEVSHYDSWSFFAWDRYGDYGLVGFAMLDNRAMRPVHFAFSCRVMHMGLERYALNKINERRPDYDFSTLEHRIPPGLSNWVNDVPFHDPTVRNRLLAQFDPRTTATEKTIRVMYDCQSGGIAHFSQHRDRIDFDNAPRFFRLRNLIPGDEPAKGQASFTEFPRLVIYGAAVDYSNSLWNGLDDLLEDGLFEACVALFCGRIADERKHMLVVLPPEDAAEEAYRPRFGMTRERVIAFNAIWRQVAAEFAEVDILELTALVTPTDMSDVSHYHPLFLQQLTGIIDDWIDAADGAISQARAA